MFFIELKQNQQQIIQKKKKKQQQTNKVERGTLIIYKNLITIENEI